MFRIWSNFGQTSTELGDLSGQIRPNRPMLADAAEHVTKFGTSRRTKCKHRPGSQQRASVRRVLDKFWTTSEFFRLMGVTFLGARRPIFCILRVTVFPCHPRPLEGSEHLNFRAQLSDPLLKVPTGAGPRHAPNPWIPRTPGHLIACAGLSTPSTLPASSRGRSTGWSLARPAGHS